MVWVRETVSPEVTCEFGSTRVQVPGWCSFLGDLGATRRTERARLQADYDRAMRVVAEIDAATTDPAEDRV